MKKTALILILSTTLMGAFAQKSSVGFAKENIVVTGALAFSTTDGGNDTKTTDFKIAPSVGYFLTDKVALGVNFGYGAGTTKAGTVTTEDNDMVELGAFARYYYTPAKAFSIFNQVGVSYATTNDKIAKLKNNSFSFHFAPGVNYFMSERVSVQATLGSISYSTSKADVAGAKSNSVLGVDLNLNSISFGLNYKF
jgi:hypothetical protein